MQGVARLPGTVHLECVQGKEDTALGVDDEIVDGGRGQLARSGNPAGGFGGLLVAPRDHAEVERDACQDERGGQGPR